MRTRSSCSKALCTPSRRLCTPKNGTYHKDLQKDPCCEFLESSLLLIQQLSRPLLEAWELPERSGAPDEEFHHPTAFAKFQNVQTLVVYLPANHGAELTKLLFLGFRGVSTGDRRGVVKAVYEARAVPSDHAAPAMVAGALGM